MCGGLNEGTKRDMCRATEHWTEHREHGENGRKSIFSDYIHRDDWFVRTVRRDTWNEAPPKVFGCLNSCQEVVLHVSHLMDLLDSSRRRGVV